MENRDEILETKEYIKFRNSVLGSRPALIKARIDSLCSTFSIICAGVLATGKRWVR